MNLFTFDTMIGSYEPMIEPNYTINKKTTFVVFYYNLGSFLLLYMPLEPMNLLTIFLYFLEPKKLNFKLNQ